MELDIPHLGAEGPNQHPGYMPHPDPNLHTIPEEDNDGWDDEMPDPYHGNELDQMPITRQVTPEASTIHMSPVSTRRSHNSTTTELGRSISFSSDALTTKRTQEKCPRHIQLCSA